MPNKVDFKYQDKRRNNGGYREMAGRISKEVRREMSKFFMGWDVVRELRHGQVRRVKRRRIILVLDMLYQKGLRGDVEAIRKYFNLTLGKARTYRSDGKMRRESRAYYSKPLRRVIDEYSATKVHIQLDESGNLIGI